MSKIILFTDLDATLLDEETYSADLSLQALKELQASDVSVIFCSSKTRKEQEIIRQTLGVRDPFIVENGSAIIVPPHIVNITERCHKEQDGTKILVLGWPIEEIQATLKKVVSITRITYKSFHDLSNEEIVHITGLDLESAARARAREFSETVVTRFSPAELKTFSHACELFGLNCTLGGRFLSVTGPGADKGRAVQMLVKCYQPYFDKIITLGVGDSQNDAPMLRAVEIPYLVQRPGGQWKNLDIVNLNYIPAIGPLGFVEMVNDIKRRWLNQN